MKLLSNRGFNCLTVGRAVFTMCLSQLDWECDQQQPFQLYATLGGNATFNSSVTFVEGGSMNQNITVIKLCRDSCSTSLYMYICPSPLGGCTNTDKVQSQVSCLDRNVSILITLRAINVSDIGMYQVELIVNSRSHEIKRLSIYFNVSKGTTLSSLLV